MEPKQEIKTFRTHDLSLAATLVACDAKLLAVENHGGSALFVFQNSESLPGVVEKYLKGEILVEPKSFIAGWKKLRSSIAEVLKK